MKLAYAVIPAAAALALGLFVAPASADPQPGDFGNVANVDRGASAPGPHCHFVNTAGGMSGFDIVTAAAHEAHLHNLGLFSATVCP